MKRKALSLILAFAMAVSLFTVGASAAEPTYGDTAGHWAEASIERWSGYGIIQGSNGKFDPDSQLTCAQLATILARLLKLPAAKDAGFIDNPADAWYYDAINRCAAAGILKGNGDGTVTPNASITRERAMVMLARALGIEPLSRPDLSKYTDVAQVSPYAQGYLAALIEAGIVGGVTADRLAPQDNITRAATVTILDRAIQTYADKAGAAVSASGGLVLVVADDVTVSGTIGRLLIPTDNIVVIVSGSKNIGSIAITGNHSTVILDNATADDVTISGVGSKVETKNGSHIKNIALTESASGAVVAAGSGTTIDNVANSAPGAAVTGSGTVKSVASDTDVTVETKNTEVKNTGRSEITVTDAKGKETTVKPGTSTTVNKGTTSSGGGGGSYTPPAQHTHTWDAGVVTKEATCTEAGVKTYTCSCGATYTEDIPAKGHNYNNGVCSNCGDKQPEVKATEKAWDALDAKLAGIKGNDGAVLVTAKREGTAYTLKLNVDAIQSGAAAFGDDFLTGLATNLKNALDENFGRYVLTADGQDVYNKGTFQNTALKNALFSVADGFFYTLNHMTEENGVYTYKTVNAKVTGDNTYAFTIAVQLEGEDVAKVKSLAGTLADHLQMEMLDSDAINSRYGITVNESKAIVVTMEMPGKLMQAGVDKIGSGEDAQKAFDGDGVTVSALLGIMNSIDSLDGVLGSNASDVNSVLNTVNSNANVVNKVLSKMTAKVTAQNGTTANFDMTFTPSNTGNAWKDFMAGVIAMTGSDEGSVGAMKPNQFKVAQEGTYKDYYYAVPVTVTVTIDLDSSMGFQATETVVVVMHIDFTKYSKTGTASVSAAEPTETPAAAETSAE